MRAPAHALARVAGTARLDQAALVRAVETLVAAPSADVAAETGADPAWVPLLLAAAAVTEALRRAFALEAVEVSPAGLREGLVAEALA